LRCLAAVAAERDGLSRRRPPADGEDAVIARRVVDAWPRIAAQIKRSSLDEAAAAKIAVDVGAVRFNASDVHEAAIAGEMVHRRRQAIQRKRHTQLMVQRLRACWQH
jgi:hypothetical protein